MFKKIFKLLPTLGSIDFDIISKYIPRFVNLVKDRTLKIGSQALDLNALMIKMYIDTVLILYKCEIVILSLLKYLTDPQE